MLSSLQDAYKRKKPPRTNPSVVKPRHNDTSSLCPIRERSFQRASPKKPDGFIRQAEVTGSVNCDFVVWVKHITSGFDSYRVGASLRQIE